MVAWEIKGMGGVIPRTDDRLIGDNMAVEAANCDLTGGQLLGLPNSVLTVDLHGKLPVVERAYRVAIIDAPPAVPDAAPTIARNPIITGTGIVGQPLHCDTGIWNNNATSWTGTWWRDDRPGGLQVGTDFVYYVQAADRGHNITCRVVASNATGSSAPATSNAIAIALPQQSTPPVNVGAPLISGSGAPGYTLHCDGGQWINSPQSFILQWFSDGQVVIATGSDYVVQASDAGHTLTVIVTASNSYGSTVSLPSNAVQITTNPDVIPPRPPGDVPAAYGAPNLTGNPTPGAQLITSMGLWNNTPESYDVQWKRDGVDLGFPVPRTSTYRVDPADIGHTITCTVTATNYFGTATSPVSNGIFIPIPITPPVNTVGPYISGGNVINQQYAAYPGWGLTVSLGSWANTPTSYSANWYHEGSGSPFASGFTYTTQNGDINTRIYAVVTASNEFGSVSAQSNRIFVGDPPDTHPPLNTAAPWIFGGNNAGNTLHCDLGTWAHTPSTYIAQWVRDGGTVLQSGIVNYVDGSNYTTDYYDGGHIITCNVIAQNAYGTTNALPSNQVYIYGYGGFSAYSSAEAEAAGTVQLPVVETPIPALTAPDTRVGISPAVAPGLPRGTSADVWLPLPSRYSSPCRSPLANDVYGRVYWTNPGDYAVHFTTTNRLKSGIFAYMDVGIVQPVLGPGVISVTGGTPPPGVTAIDRSYCYTFINEFNEESSPSPASDIASGPPDASWLVGFPLGTPDPPVGVAYSPIVKMRLYRTITGATSGAQFYHVTEFNKPFPSTYDDHAPDSEIVMNEVLETVGWGNPPPYLDGLVSMPGGFFAGFTGNTVHFTEPDRPHTWPKIYDQSAHYDIISLAVWQQYLVVLTAGYPSAGSGNMPSNIMLVQTQVNEPCIARGSVVVDMTGVFYASQNGLVQFTGYGITNITAPILEKNEWLTKYNARYINGARHRSQYIAVNNTQAGFLVDYAEQRLGFQDLTYMQNIVCIWNDEYTGDTFMCTAGGQVYQWDVPGQVPQTYRWRSKQFFTPMPISLGAVQIELDREVLAAQPPDNHPLDNNDTRVDLPSGVNAQFRYYAGPRLQLTMVRNLSQQMEIFRLPKGFRAFDHQIEVISRVPIASIQLATTLSELKKV